MVKQVNYIWVVREGEKEVRTILLKDRQRELRGHGGSEKDH